MYAIYTSQQLSADPTYDSEANKSGWEKIVKFLFGFKMDNTAKSVTGLVAALLAIALLAGPVGWSISAAVLVVTGSMIATSLMSAGIGALNAAVSGGDVVKGLNDGLADGLFWSGLSAFISAGISAIRVALSNFAQMRVKVANCTGECFIAGTLVLTEEGYKKIEEIKVGDKVLSYDEKTGEQGYKEVVRLFRNKTEEWYHVFVGEEELICTGGHPFYVKGKGYVKAKDLKLSDILLLSDKTEVEITRIGKEKLKEAETTYNFEVAEFHTYYVSQIAVLVHNACLNSKIFTKDQQAVIDLAKENKVGLRLDDANTLVGWAREYGISAHGPMIHPGRTGIWSIIEHINVFKYHIPIIK